MEKIDQVFRVLYTVIWVLLGVSTLAVMWFLWQKASWPHFITPGIGVFVAWICFKRFPKVYEALGQKAALDSLEVELEKRDGGQE
ncbi:hypothetical protein K6V78_03435 [Streptococcus gallolyticus]|uniref:hypothetical protein n=1 Tax=Streptococcus hepaticus TaxID=3349163 RepID=UPI001C953047|nr:hypothetical protein [Streptococcus gallolyticus]MBY5040726.1 hypothetical protein [Streptococcus gallolyticus]